MHSESQFGNDSKTGKGGIANFQDCATGKSKPLHDGILFGNLGQVFGLDLARVQDKLVFANGHMRHLHFMFRDAKEQVVKEDIDHVGPIGKVFLLGLCAPLVGTQQENFFFAQSEVAKSVLDRLDLIRRNHLHALLGQVLIKIQKKDLQARSGLVKDGPANFGQALFLFDGSLVDARHRALDGVFIENDRVRKESSVLGKLLHSQLGKGKLAQLERVHL